MKKLYLSKTFFKIARRGIHSFSGSTPAVQRRLSSLDSILTHTFLNLRALSHTYGIFWPFVTSPFMLHFMLLFIKSTRRESISKLNYYIVECKCQRIPFHATL